MAIWEAEGKEQRLTKLKCRNRSSQSFKVKSQSFKGKISAFSKHIYTFSKNMYINVCIYVSIHPSIHTYIDIRYIHRFGRGCMTA